MNGEPEKSRAGLSPRVAHISSAMSIRSQREAGFALVTAISFLVIVGILVATSLLLGLSNRTRSSETLITTQAQVAAEAGMDEVYRQVVLDVFEGLPIDSRTLSVYKQRLLTKSFSVNLASGSATDLTLSLSATFLNTSLNGTSYQKSGIVNFTSNLGSATVPIKFDVKVQRVENPSADQTVLYVRSTGTVSNATGEKSRRVLEQTIYVRAPIIAPDFAVLSDNVNCTFCHTKVTSMKAAYGAIPDTDRVRVGTLSSLELRFQDSGPDSTDTLIGGTLYTRGQFIDQNRVDITSARLSTGIQDFQTYSINSANGKVGSSALQKLNVQDCNTANQCTSQNNFYLNYPKGDAATKLDGALPSNFPLPVRDINNNRVIDLTEWISDIDKVKDKEGGYGSIGISTTVGSSIKLYDNSGIQQATGNTLPSGPSGIIGNLYIKGDINIDKTVYIDGDVVITGKVFGKGKIVAKGNIYVTGDLQYKCTANTLCTNAQYADPDNIPSSLGLLSGGNVIMGDYLTGRSDFNQRNRLLDVNDVANWTDGSWGFTIAEIANFNKLEYDKARLNANYIPRFYKLRNNDSQFYVYSGNGENANSAGDTIQLSATDPMGAGRAFVTSSLAPAGTWRTDKSIKQEWIDNVELDITRPAKTPLRVDAALYSSNAIFGLVRGSSNNGGSMRSVTDGKMVINGAVIAPDLGLLAAGSGGKKRKAVNDEATLGVDNYGLKIHYDPRAKNLLSVEDPAQVARSYYKLVKDS